MGIKAGRPGGADAGRGDNPHAEPNAVSKWTVNENNSKYQDADISEDTYHDRMAEYNSTYEEPAFDEDSEWPDDKNDFRVQRMSAKVEKLDNGRWKSTVYRPSSNSNWQFWGQDYDGPLFEKDFRTEKRAKIAAEAMINRRNQGMDFKTGRTPERGWNFESGSPY